MEEDVSQKRDNTGAGIDVRATQLGCEPMTTAKHVEWQIAITVVVAVKEPAFLVPVQRIVGRIEIEPASVASTGSCAVRRDRSGPHSQARCRPHAASPTSQPGVR